MLALQARYASWPAESLRVGIRVYSAPLFCLLFADVLAAMELELLARELPLIADESGGFVVAAPGGLE